ncbi:MAG: hypothetical protein EPO20_30550 [Betaproteobacteria bacterium]|nr:MAG: hypothetical protein EPO20_30550 [Betaproteobacteria bacterium]
MGFIFGVFWILTLITAWTLLPDSSGPIADFGLLIALTIIVTMAYAINQWSFERKSNEFWKYAVKWCIAAGFLLTIFISALGFALFASAFSIPSLIEDAPAIDYSQYETSSWYYERVLNNDGNTYFVFTSGKQEKEILLNTKLMPEIRRMYSTFYPLEGGLCLDAVESDGIMKIDSWHKADLQESTKTTLWSLSKNCPILLHTHPHTEEQRYLVSCNPSAADLWESYRKNEIQAVACGFSPEMQYITFYSLEEK